MTDEKDDAKPKPPPAGDSKSPVESDPPKGDEQPYVREWRVVGRAAREYGAILAGLFAAMGGNTSVAPPEPADPPPLALPPPAPEVVAPVKPPGRRGRGAVKTYRRLQVEKAMRQMDRAALKAMKPNALEKKFDADRGMCNSARKTVLADPEK